MNNDEKQFDIWLRANGGLRHPAITIGHDPITGRGLYTSQALEAGTALGVIPHSLILTVDVARRSAIGDAVTQLNSGRCRRTPISDRVLLYLYIMSCRHDASSRWFEWLRVWPNAYSDPLSFTPTELNALAGTNLVEAVPARHKRLKQRFDSLFPLATELFPAVFPADVFTWANFLWAHSSYSSRGFPSKLVPPPSTASADAAPATATATASSAAATATATAAPPNAKRKRSEQSPSAAAASIDANKRTKSDSKRDTKTDSAATASDGDATATSAAASAAASGEESEDDIFEPYTAADVKAGRRKRATLRTVGVMIPFFDMTNHRTRTQITWKTYPPLAPAATATATKSKATAAATGSTNALVSALRLSTDAKQLESYRTGASSGCVVFYTDERIESGGEVYNNYGGKGNEEFLFGYGFTVSDNAAADTFVVALSPPPPAAPDADTKRALFSQFRIPLNHYLRCNALPPALLCALRVLTATPFELAQLPTVATGTVAGFDSSAHPLAFISARNELAMCQTLIELIEARLHKLSVSWDATGSSKRYATATAAQSADRALLQTGIRSADSKAGGVSFHSHCALTYRCGQRDVLFRSHALVLALQQRTLAEAMRSLALPRGVSTADMEVSSAAAETRAHAKWLASNRVHCDRVAFRCLTHESDLPIRAVTTKPVAAGDVLFSAPLTACISAARARTGDAAFASALAASAPVTNEIDDDALLILYLMFHAARCDDFDEAKEQAASTGAADSKAVDSELAPFLRPLLNHPMHGTVQWSDEEMAVFGAESPVAIETRSQHLAMRELFDSLVPDLCEIAPSHFNATDYGWERFLWAAHILDVYSITAAATAGTTAPARSGSSASAASSAAAAAPSDGDTTSSAPVSLIVPLPMPAIVARPIDQKRYAAAVTAAKGKVPTATAIPHLEAVVPPARLPAPIPVSTPFSGVRFVVDTSTQTVQCIALTALPKDAIVPFCADSTLTGIELFVRRATVLAPPAAGVRTGLRSVPFTLRDVFKFMQQHTTAPALTGRHMQVLTEFGLSLEATHFYEFGAAAATAATAAAANTIAPSPQLADALTVCCLTSSQLKSLQKQAAMSLALVRETVDPSVVSGFAARVWDAIRLIAAGTEYPESDSKSDAPTDLRSRIEVQRVAMAAYEQQQKPAAAASGDGEVDEDAETARESIAIRKYRLALAERFANQI